MIDSIIVIYIMLLAPGPPETQGEEIKVLDYDASAGVAFSTSPTPFLIFCPAQGSDISNRIGRETILKNVYIRGDVVGHSVYGGMSDGSYIPVLNRIILFVDWQVNGTMCSASDVLTNQVGSPTLSSRAHINLNNRDRFKILRDLSWIIGGYYKNAANGIAWHEGRQSYQLKEFIDLSYLTEHNGIKTTYKVSPGTSVVGDIATGAVCMMCISSSSSAGAFTGFIRNRFVG